MSNEDLQACQVLWPYPFPTHVYTAPNSAPPQQPGHYQFHPDYTKDLLDELRRLNRNLELVTRAGALTTKVVS